jgi:hypothetical protein
MLAALPHVKSFAALHPALPSTRSSLIVIHVSLPAHQQMISIWVMVDGGSAEWAIRFAS